MRHCRFSKAKSPPIDSSLVAKYLITLGERGENSYLPKLGITPDTSQPIGAVYSPATESLHVHDPFTFDNLNAYFRGEYFRRDYLSHGEIQRYQIRRVGDSNPKHFGRDLNCLPLYYGGRYV